MYTAYLRRIREKGERYVERYGKYALIVFVAVPFPGSGAYSGALFSYLFGLKLRDVALGLFIGTLLSGLLVTLTSVSLAALV